MVQNREGFLVNRVFVPYLQEAFWLLEEGAAAPEIDSAAVEFGFPMGPLVLIDMSGLDILVQCASPCSPRHFPGMGRFRRSSPAPGRNAGIWARRPGRGFTDMSPAATHASRESRDRQIVS